MRGGLDWTRTKSTEYGQRGGGTRDAESVCPDGSKDLVWFEKDPTYRTTCTTGVDLAYWEGSVGGRV